MTSTPTYEKDKPYGISIIDFHPDPNQLRKVFNEEAGENPPSRELS